jgi:hypothetical protein
LILDGEASEHLISGPESRCESHRTVGHGLRSDTVYVKVSVRSADGAINCGNKGGGIGGQEGLVYGVFSSPELFRVWIKVVMIRAPFLWNQGI